jgi:DNA-binding XRE family transcriptional regulator
VLSSASDAGQANKQPRGDGHFRTVANDHQIFFPTKIVGLLRNDPQQPSILGMKTLAEIGKAIASARGASAFRQADLAMKAGLSRATIDALENGRASDIGVSKLSRILAVLGLELSIRPATNERPTLDELMKDETDD